MKKSKFSEDQIVRILQEGQSGQMSQAGLCRKHGISQARTTFASASTAGWRPTTSSAFANWKPKTRL